jgi:hypothetical protein
MLAILQQIYLIKKEEPITASSLQEVVVQTESIASTITEFLLMKIANQ